MAFLNVIFVGPGLPDTLVAVIGEDLGFAANLIAVDTSYRGRDTKPGVWIAQQPASVFGAAGSRLTRPEFVEATQVPAEGGILYLSSTHANRYEIALAVHTNTYSRRYFERVDVGTNFSVMLTKAGLALGLITADASGEVLQELYNPVSGAVLPAEMDKTDRAFLMHTIKMGMRHLNDFYACGVHLKEMLRQPPGWVFQLGTPWLQSLVDIYAIRASSPDVDLQIDILTSAQARLLLFNMCQGILASFSINNNFITSEEVTAGGGWSEINAWLPIVHFKME